VFVLLSGGCKQNKPTTNNNSETDLFAQTEDTIALSPIVIDSTLIRINEVIAEEFAVRNFKYEIVEKRDTTIEDYSYIVDDWYKNGYTRISLTIETFNSEQSARQKLTEIQKLHEENINSEFPSKMIARYFRLNNKLYSFSSSENISHIKNKILTRIIEEKQIKEEDTGIL